MPAPSNKLGGPLVLVILDGFGERAERDGNAIKLAKTPTLDLLATYPHTTIGTSGPDVGLPPGQMGNTGKGYFFGPRLFDMDLALLKRIQIHEAMNLEVRADAINFTNTPSFGPPTLTYTSSLFGRIGGSLESGPGGADNSRKIQLGLKFNF